MSVVAVKITKEQISISADSIIMKGDLKRNNFKKLHSCRNITVGGCGNVQELSIFFEFINSHEPSSATSSDIQRFMKVFAEYKEQLTGDSKLENEYIIVFKQHVFEVDGFFVQEVTDYAAIGEGEVYALAALVLGHTAEEAVKVACDLSCYASEPIISYTVSLN